MTYRCNIDCPYCFNPNHNLVDELSTSEWTRLIREARDQGSEAAIFTGGEPTIRKDSRQLIEFAHTQGLRTAMSTNGLLPSTGEMQQLAKYLDVLQISIHPWRYAEDLSSGVKEFSRKAKAFKEGGGAIAVFNVVLYRGLVGQLSALLETISANAEGFLDSIGIQGASPYGHGYLNPSSIPTMAECKEAAGIVDGFRSHTSIQIKNTVATYFDVKPNTWGTYGIIINPEGYLLPMIEGADSLFYIFDHIEFDNVRNKKLADVWRSSRILNQFRGVDWHREPCVSCSVRETCRGGSRLNAYILTRDMWNADPFCILSPHHGKVIELYSGDGQALLAQ